MRKSIIIEKALCALALAAIGGCCAFVFVGCTSTTAEWGGESVVYGLDGAPLVDKDGVVQKVKNPVKLSSWRHWIKTLFTAAKLNVRKDEIELAMDGYKAEPSEELNKVIETSFKGASELAAKIGAAIATSGGSVAGEAGFALLKSAITKYITRGGDAKNATITCKDGNCTISDGTITETCTDCLAK